MPISIDEFNQGTEITNRMPVMAVMREGTAYSTKEIAELLGISHASARQRLIRHLARDEIIRKKIHGRAYCALKID